MSRYSLKGQSILITGGGRGIGRLMALEATRRGAARVVIWDLDGLAAESVRDEIHALGGKSLSFQVNVANRDQVDRVAAEVGVVDILINGAGIVGGKKLLESSPEMIERTFQVNVLALYWVTRAFLGGMISRGQGTVVTMASAAGLVGVARQTDYSASKFAAFGFAESLRAELAQDSPGVKSLVVCPYYVSTGMFDGVQSKFPLLLPILKPEYVAEKTLDAIELGKQQVIMPRFVRLTPLLRILPIRAFDAVVSFMGINHSMDHFVGRSPAGQKSVKQ